MSVSQRLEIRAQGDGGLMLTGYAATTEEPYDVGWYEEVIARGAFKRTLGNGPGGNPDVILTVNHGHVGSGLPIARTTAGTLHLSEDHRGLLVNADLDPLDPEVQSLHRKMQRGDLDGQMSFAFRAIEQEWNKARTKRRIKVAEIHKGDVSIVNYGANDRTTSSIQGQDTRAGVPLEVRQRRVDVLGQRVSTGVAVLERTGTDCARCDGTGEITIRCPTCGGGEPPARSAPLVRPDYATENVLRLLAARGRSTAPARRGAKPLPVDWRAQYEALRKKAS